MAQQDLPLLVLCGNRPQPSVLEEGAEHFPLVVIGGSRLYFWHFGQKCVLRPATFTRLISVPQT